MGVVGLEKALSSDLAPEVRANAVLPAGIETPRIAETVGAAVERGEFDSFEESFESRTAGIPLGRFGDPEVLGNTVAYLSSPRSAFINGVTISIDGGASHSTL